MRHVDGYAFLEIHLKPTPENVAVGQAGQVVDLHFAQGLLDRTYSK